MNIFERVLAIIASTVTILNFLMTLLYHSKTSGNVMLPAVEDISVGLENISITNRVIITFILQCALGYTSGVFVGLSAKLRDSLMLILFCMIGAISVWLSFFNLEYVLIIGPVTGFWGFLLFGVALFIVLGIEQVTFYEYADDGDHKNFDLIVGIQGVVFVMLVIASFFR